MKSGLLWYDNNRKTSLADKIEAAAKRYREKFGKSPNQIYINPVDAELHPDQFQRARNEIEARGGNLDTKKTIMPNHIWLGIKDWECCVSGCTARTDPRNTMYCPEHFVTIGVGAPLEAQP